MIRIHISTWERTPKNVFSVSKCQNWLEETKRSLKTWCQICRVRCKQPVINVRGQNVPSKLHKCSLTPHSWTRGSILQMVNERCWFSIMIWPPGGNVFSWWDLTWDVFPNLLDFFPTCSYQKRLQKNVGKWRAIIKTKHKNYQCSRLVRLSTGVMGQHLTCVGAQWQAAMLSGA